MNDTAVDWWAHTPPNARNHTSQPCRRGDHTPACDGYYPPGPDTYHCLCACHDQETSP